MAKQVDEELVQRLIQQLEQVTQDGLAKDRQMDDLRQQMTDLQKALKDEQLQREQAVAGERREKEHAVARERREKKRQLLEREGRKKSYGDDYNESKK